ncbi:hypothetical protein GCM10022217_09830 [Chryseobacterium ginsenosidimutans]|uniref:hypothetical protein n=1 Tax=Chryseobacterium ginsenosidimutans TaxID=687846 RepID=UPI0031D316E1
MRKKMSLRLSLLTVFLTFLWSCHNEDFAKGETVPQRNNSEFFTHAKKGGANAKSGVDYIDILEAYNRDKDFLSQMPDQKGMPIWDKMYTVDTESATGLMIPLSYDDETMSSILFVTLDSKNEVTGVKDYDNTLLQNIVYDQNISKENRENLFLTFMQMDNRTFGNEHFIGIPKDLFVGKKSDDEYGIMWVRNFAPSSTVTTDETGKLMIIESCFIALHCTHHGGGNICDAEDGCTQCGTTFCTYEVIGTADDPFPSSPSGGGGGGGGGGCSDCGGGGTTPGPNVPTNPCGTNLGTVFYRLAPGCGGNTDLPDLDNPCEKIKSIVNNAQLKPKIDIVKQFSLTAVEDEMGFQQDKSGNVTPAPVNGAHHVDFLVDQNSLGGIHCHTLNGTHMFSPKDILTFLSFAEVQNQTLPSGSITDNTGNAFLGMIAQSGSYFITFNGGSGDLPPPMTEAEEEAFEAEMNEAYGKILKLQLKAEGKHKGDDLSQQGLQKLFFDVIKEMGLEGKINLIQQNGSSTSTIEQNSDGTIKDPIPC